MMNAPMLRPVLHVKQAISLTPPTLTLISVLNVPSQAAQCVLMLKLVVLVQQESGLTSKLSSV